MDDDFYKQLAADYDRVIPWEKRLRNERPWFEALWKRFGVTRVLDASCGTGRHLALFAQMGLEVVGADGSGEMVELARRNVKDLGFEVPVYECQWKQIDSAVPGQYPAVLCIGNSLPYVTQLDSLRSSLAGLWSKVAPGGFLLLQFKNFVKLQTSQQRFLPLSSSDTPCETVALRLYDYLPDHIDFNVILLQRQPGAEWTMRHQVTQLRPYCAEEIQRELEALQASVELNGDLALRPFDLASSEDVVLLAQRA